jgi:hypothetical protein
MHFGIFFAIIAIHAVDQDEKLQIADSWLNITCSS